MQVFFLTGFMAMHVIVFLEASFSTSCKSSGIVSLWSSIKSLWRSLYFAPASSHSIPCSFSNFDSNTTAPTSSKDAPGALGDAFTQPPTKPRICSDARCVFLNFCLRKTKKTEPHSPPSQSLRPSLTPISWITLCRVSLSQAAKWQSD